MLRKRNEKLRKLINLGRMIYFVRKELASLKPQFEEAFEYEISATITRLNEALENLKVIIGDLIVENIYESWRSSL